MILSLNSVCRGQILYSWKIQHLPLPTNHQLLPLLLIYRIQMRMLKGPKNKSERKCTTSLNCFLEKMTFDGWKYCEGKRERRMWQFVVMTGDLLSSIWSCWGGL